MRRENNYKLVIVIGLGEIGKPLYELLSQHYEVLGVDIDPVDCDRACDVMHICFPFQVGDFVQVCVTYIEKYKPDLTVINSTVAPGTTRAIHQRTGARIAYSPVRGKHIKMKQELLHYVKFIGGIDRKCSQETAEHFESFGMKTKILSSPESAELAKLTETTYLGVLITWAQEIERYCDQFSLNYDEIVSFFDEISYLPPVRYFPGIIGGHCVMPNIAILKSLFRSDLLDAIESSNELKEIREASKTG